MFTIYKFLTTSMKFQALEQFYFYLPTPNSLSLLLNVLVTTFGGAWRRIRIILIYLLISDFLSLSLKLCPKMAGSTVIYSLGEWNIKLVFGTRHRRHWHFYTKLYKIDIFTMWTENLKYSRTFCFETIFVHDGFAREEWRWAMNYLCHLLFTTLFWCLGCGSAQWTGTWSLMGNYLKCSNYETLSKTFCDIQ